MAYFTWKWKLVMSGQIPLHTHTHTQTPWTNCHFIALYT